VITAYHFVGDTLRDGSPIPANGEWLEVAPPLVICKHGLHWSPHPYDALQYAPGNTLCLVEADGEVVEQDDKGCSTRRRIVARIDAESLLFDFARWTALQVIHLWDAPAVVCQFLATGDESLRVAARVTARRVTAHAARSNAAWAAAWAAAEDAWAAARAARDAASQKQRDEFQRRVDAAFSSIVEVA
jgi:hypothetical protein